MIQPTLTTKSISFRIIYIRFRGTYQDFRKAAGPMSKRLFDYGYANGLVNPDFTKILTIYNDNPYITQQQNLRTSVAMTIPNDAIVTLPDDLSETIIEGTFRIGHFDISRNEYGDAWKFMIDEWLTNKELSPRDTAPFELYVTQPPRNSKDTSLTDIYIPIED